MIPSPADPVAFTLLGISVRWYALFILAGVFLGLMLSRWIAARRGLDRDFPLDLAPMVVITGIVCARLAYVLVRGSYFLEQPAEILNVRGGGLAIHGALIGGAVATIILCRRRGQSVLVWADILVAGVALGQAVGRWGNWANQEAYGRPTSGWWGLQIDASRRLPGFESFSTFHPTFLYESVLNALNAAVLTWIALRIRPRGPMLPGFGLGVYLANYGLIRLLTESVRIDSLKVGPLPGATWVSLLFVITGIWFSFSRWSRNSGALGNV